jgi:hypothetical protein
MHAALACNAFKLSRLWNDKVRQHGQCTATACAASRDKPLESLTHLFITCPSVAPALQWLLCTWQRIAGVQLEPKPAVILGDDPAAWSPGTSPTALQHTLWTRLRIAFLHTVWMARSSSGSRSSAEHAAAIAAAVVRNIDDQIRSDWLRVTGDIRKSGAICSSWFRGRDPGMSEEDFADRWALGGVLCECQDGSLVVHISESRPVPIPAAVMDGTAGDA